MCSLLEDVIRGDVVVDSEHTIGFCPKPAPDQYTIAYNDQNYSVNIPENIETKWWCYKESVNGSEKLCHFPFMRFHLENPVAVFEPFVGTDNEKHCLSFDKKFVIATICTKQGMIAQQF